MPYIYERQAITQNNLFKLIEKRFYQAKLIRKEIRDKRQERETYIEATKFGECITGHAFVSDPTCQKALDHTRPITTIVLVHSRHNEEVVKWPEIWLDVYDTTKREFVYDELTSTIMLDRYYNEKGKNDTLKELNISHTVYYNAVNAIVNFGINVALQDGLIAIR